MTNTFASALVERIFDKHLFDWVAQDLWEKLVLVNPNCSFMDVNIPGDLTPLCDWANELFTRSYALDVSDDLIQSTDIEIYQLFFKVRRIVMDKKQKEVE